LQTQATQKENPMNLTPLPALDWPAYTEIVSRRDTLAADLHAAQVEADRLRRTRGDAERADEDARAAALINGKTDPGKKITAKHIADLAAAEDRAALLDRAVRTQDAAAVALVQAEPERARDAASAEAAAAGTAYLALIAALAEARSEFHAARRAADWVAEPTRKFKAAAVPGLTARNLTTANGDPADVGVILAALADEVQGDPEMVDGPWRNSPRIPKSEAVRMVRRTRAEFTEGGQIDSTTFYAIPQSDVERDDAERQTARAAEDRRQQARTLRAMEQENPGSTTPAPAPVAAAVGADPLADLR
jgi:hypothetical protein